MLRGPRVRRRLPGGIRRAEPTGSAGRTKARISVGPRTGVRRRRTLRRPPAKLGGRTWGTKCHSDNLPYNGLWPNQCPFPLPEDTGNEESAGEPRALRFKVVAVPDTPIVVTRKIEHARISSIAHEAQQTGNAQGTRQHCKQKNAIIR